MDEALRSECPLQCSDEIMQLENEGDSSLEPLEDAPNTEGEIPATIGKRTGRSMSPIWDFFTEDAYPHLAKSATCKHCSKSVVYHRKSEVVKRHLLKCIVFKKEMLKMEESERPEWFHLIQRAKTSTQSTSSQKSIRAYALPPVSAANKASFQEKIALHYYITGKFSDC